MLEVKQGTWLSPELRVEKYTLPSVRGNVELHSKVMLTGRGKHLEPLIQYATILLTTGHTHTHGKIIPFCGIEHIANCVCFSLET